MKFVNSQTNDVQFGTGDKVKVDAVGIAQQKKLTSILINLYTDPFIWIQELLSNAYDSHIEAGVTKNVKVTVEEESVTISDWGMGMDPDRVKLTYSLLNSTKEETNDMIGGYGLGSKSPLSYCDAFTLITVSDGIEYIYTITIEDDAVTPVLLHSKETDKENQSHITVPTKRNQLDLIIERVKIKSLYMDNVEYSGLMKDYKKTVFKLNDRLYYCPDLDYKDHIIIGNVPYTISTIYGRSSFGCYGVHFDVGEITPLPTREGVQLTGEVQTIIDNRIEEATKEFSKYVNEHYVHDVDSLSLDILYGDTKIYFKIHDKVIAPNGFGISVYQLTRGTCRGIPITALRDHVRVWSLDYGTMEEVKWGIDYNRLKNKAVHKDVIANKYTSDKAKRQGIRYALDIKMPALSKDAINSTKVRHYTVRAILKEFLETLPKYSNFNGISKFKVVSASTLTTTNTVSKNSAWYDDKGRYCTGELQHHFPKNLLTVITETPVGYIDTLFSEVKFVRPTYNIKKKLEKLGRKVITLPEFYSQEGFEKVLCKKLDSFYLDIRKKRNRREFPYYVKYHLNSKVHSRLKENLLYPLPTSYNTLRINLYNIGDTILADTLSKAMQEVSQEKEDYFEFISFLDDTSTTDFEVSKFQYKRILDANRKFRKSRNSTDSNN